MVGTLGEQRVCQILTEAGIENRRNPEKSNRKVMIQWDIEAHVGGRRFTLEAKFDVMAARTGNLAIEYWNVRQGKPSGILATTSDVWVFVLSEPAEVWVAKTSALKNHFETVTPFREIACGGDDNAAMKLFRKDELLPAVFHRLDGLAPGAVADLLKNLLEM